MDRSFDVPDSTDWLPTPLSGLATIEAALRCQVCKDFFDTPMITSCSHTFCSLCIRRCLSNEGKCPACRAGNQEVMLRRNWAVQELVDSFKRSRAGMLQFAKDAVVGVEESDAAQLPSKKKRRLRDKDIDSDESVRYPQTRRTRSQSRKSEQVDGPAVIDDSEDKDFEPGRSRFSKFKATKNTSTEY